MRPSFSLAELLPHRPPMVLLDDLVDFDIGGRSLTAEFRARARWTGNWVAIEYMAQTAAALAGAFDRLADAARPARPGFLLGTRHLSLNLPQFEEDAIYRVKATCVFEDANAASFACEITDVAGRVVATAILNAFRPDDIAAFLEEMRK